MLPTVKRPSMDVEVVTDYETLDKSRAMAKQIEQVEQSDTASMTEAEVSAHRKTADDMRAALETLVRKVNETTLVLTLEGMNASKWEQLVLMNTQVKDDRPVQDTSEIVATATSAMCRKITLKDSGEPVELDRVKLHDLLSQLPDSAVIALLSQVQALNMPMFKLPKA